MSLLSPRSLGFVMLAALVASAPAHADKRKASEAEAQAHYERALSYYNLREYGIAVLEFKEAYAISNEPLLLFNIGQAYRLDKQYEEALHYYRTFLQLRPRAPNRHDVEQFIAEMEHMLKTEAHLSHDDGAPPPPEGAATEGPTVLPGTPPVSEAPETAPRAKTAPLSAPPPSLVTSTPAPEKKPLRKRWWVWTAAGAGVAALGVGLAVGLTVGRHEVLPSGSLGSIDARH